MNKGWEIKKLGEIGKVYNGNSINERVKKDRYANLDEGYPYIATKDIGYDSAINYGNGIIIPFQEKASFKIAPPNTILICAEGGSAGRKIGFAEQEICFGNKLFALSPKPNFNSRFVYYWYFSSQFQKHFSSNLAGIIGGVSLNKFKEIDIPLPPLPEQQQIVAILDEAFAAIDCAKEKVMKNINNTKYLFESYLERALQTKHGKIYRLEEICNSERIITYGVIKLGEETFNGIPCLRTSNVRWLKVDLEGIKRIQHSLSKEYSRTIIQGDEVLVNVRGTLGGVCITTKEMIGWNISREVAMVPINTALAEPEYVAFWIGSNSSQKWLSSVKKGAAYTGINIEDLRNLPVLIPNMNEQKEASANLNKAHKNIISLRSLYERKLASLEELKKSILQKAFAGELTSSEDDNKLRAQA